MNDTATPLELRISRLVPATPEEVFDAYTNAEKQKIWFSILDERPGIVDIEVDRPSRLVTESTGSGPDGTTMTTRIEITFDPEGDGTRMNVVRSGFPVPEVRDFFVDEVWNGALARIAAYLVRNRSS
jgi:uncharacterized protein YndB with AHSA1/START domain